MATLKDLFEDTLKDIYYAEKQIYKTLPKMAKMASSPSLKSAFEEHRMQTETQIQRLDSVFELLGKRAQGKKCPAIEGILEEGAELMEEHEKGPALDAGMLGAAQAVEHYEMARYGTLIAWSKELGMDDACALLQENYSEEEATDESLSELAEGEINGAANEGAEDVDEEPEPAEMKKPAGKTPAKGKMPAKAG